MSKEDKAIVKRTLIMLRIYAAFMENAGANAEDIKCEDVLEHAQKEVKRAGVEGERATAILLAVADQL